MEERLAGIKFSTLHNQLTKSRVKNILLSLPKFRIQSSHELIDSMKEVVGLTFIFPIINIANVFQLILPHTLSLPSAWNENTF